LVDGTQIDQEYAINTEYTYGPILFDLSKLIQDQLENQIQLTRSKDFMILIKNTLDINQLKISF
jgi:hypothetical protein